MTRLLLPALFTLFVWWASTGIILWLNRLPRRWHPAYLGVWTLVALAAAGGLRVSSGSDTVAGAYCAFTCAILIWAWQEVAFLLGFVTGSRRSPATPALTGWARAREALHTVEHHELALLLLFALVAAVSWGQPNPVGLWTFAVLWCMRQSAKLNLFLGVRNLYESFLPAHLQYLHTYFRRRRMNALFPLSILLSTALLLPLGQQALQATEAASATALSLVAVLLALAILEHWFLVLPLPSEALWRWATGRGDAASH